MIFGNNVITRSGELVCRGLEKVGINRKFILGIASGFMASFYGDQYIKAAINSLMPPPVAALTQAGVEVAQEVAQTALKPIKSDLPFYVTSVIPSVVLGSLGNDHFLSGNIVGCGIALIFSTPQLSGWFIAGGLLYEWLCVREK
jgi:hypothetical protein